MVDNALPGHRRVVHDGERINGGVNQTDHESTTTASND
jgi:hypothetical protein